MKGKITAVRNALTPGGFGFLRDSEGDDRYFREENVIVGTRLVDLKIGMTVDFEPTMGGSVTRGNGLRADKVSPVDR